MLGGLLLLLLVLGGLGILFGFTDWKRIGQLLIWLIAGPLLICIAFNEWFGFYNSLSLPMKTALIAGSPFFALLILRVRFPKSAVVRGITDILWNTVVFFLSFPFRLLYRSGRLILQRERRPPRLAPQQIVVSRQPPLAQPRRNSGQADHEE